MNQLLDKFEEYKSIANFRMRYELSNGMEIDFKFRQMDFPHLIGLHKLIDIPVIRQFNDASNKTVSAKYIISKLKKQELLTESIIRRSSYFNNIQMRFDAFSKETILTMSYTDAIIDFDASLIGSSLKAKFILFDQSIEQGYNHLCIAEDTKQIRYVESFFYNPTDLYIRKQKVIRVNKIQIFDKEGKLYLEDTY